MTYKTKRAASIRYIKRDLVARGIDPRDGAAVAADRVATYDRIIREAQARAGKSLSEKPRQ